MFCNSRWWRRRCKFSPFELPPSPRGRRRRRGGNKRKTKGRWEVEVSETEKFWNKRRCMHPVPLYLHSARFRRRLEKESPNYFRVSPHLLFPVNQQPAILGESPAFSSLGIGGGGGGRRRDPKSAHQSIVERKEKKKEREMQRPLSLILLSKGKKRRVEGYLPLLL